MEMPDNYPEKSDNKMRVFDDDGYRQRAACICVRNETEDQILLITSHRDPTSWIIPGGGVEPNESVNDAAHRELYEEAGVKGRIGRQLGVFENNERKHRTTVFVVYCEEEYDDWEDKRLVNRQRRWYSLNDTIQMIRRSKPSQLPFLQTFLQTSPHQAKFHQQFSFIQH